ncbi:aldehyde dehydrogenase family protein [Streptomyces sp. NPDC001020]
MPIGIATNSEGMAPIGLARYHAGLARTTPLEDRRPRFDGVGETVVLREPVGVVAAIVPWNFPQPLAMFKIAPALAAGCTVVLKPAEQTGLGALEIAAAERAGLPPGVLSVVTGGTDLGRLLVAHPGVDEIAFAGSTAAGCEVAETAGRLLRPLTLHLGARAAQAGNRSVPSWVCAVEREVSRTAWPRTTDGTTARRRILRPASPR